MSRVPVCSLTPKHASMKLIGWATVMGLVVAPGVARYVFNCVAIALIELNHQVLVLAGASCDADRDCDAVCAGELLDSVPCVRLILTTSLCSSAPVHPQARLAATSSILVCLPHLSSRSPHGLGSSTCSSIVHLRNHRSREARE